MKEGGRVSRDARGVVGASLSTLEDEGRPARGAPAPMARESSTLGQVEEEEGLGWTGPGHYSTWAKCTEAFLYFFLFPFSASYFPHCFIIN